MKTDPSEKPQDRNDDLRRRAEEALNGKPVDLEGLQTEDIQYLLHELQVHQAELAIQNEELRRVQLELEISRDLYSDLYDFAPAGYCTLSEKGRILNANRTLARMLGIDREKLLHRLLSDFVDRASQDEYYIHCQRAYQKQQRAESEIGMVKTDGKRITMRVESAAAPGAPTQLMMMLSDITEQRQLEVNQQGYIARMELQRRLIEQSEKERGELARNLHDGPLQNLAGLGFSVQIIKEVLSAQGFDGSEDFERIKDEIKNLSVELRGICNDLRPPVLSRFGLRRALQESASNFHTKHPNIRIKFEFSDDPTLLPESVSLALYRIYQQALSNTIRHTQASEIWVRLKIKPQDVLFEIQDNGQGFTAAVDWREFVLKGHLGIVGMKERAEAVGGSMQLITQPGHGTLVQVVVPLDGHLPK